MSGTHDADVHLHLHIDRHLLGYFDLRKEVKRIMTTLAEHAAALTQLNTRLTDTSTEVGKISGETQGLQAQVRELQDAINSQGSTTPEVDAAMAAVLQTVDSLAARVKAVDDLVPDPLPPPTP